MADWKEVANNWSKMTDIQKEMFKEYFVKIPQAKLTEYFKRNPDAARVYELAVGTPPALFVITSEVELRLLGVFKEKLVLRGFSDRFAEREGKARRKDILEEASPAKSLNEAVRLVETYAERYSRLYPREPPARREYPVEVAMGEPTEEVSRISASDLLGAEGKCPVDGKTMDSVKRMELRSVVYKVKEDGLIFQCPEHGYFLWDRNSRRYAPINRALILKELVDIETIRPPPTTKGWICQMYKTLHMKGEDIAKEMGLSVEYVQDVMKECDEGKVEPSILPPAAEWREMKKRGMIES
jgi:hypothetical protein